MINMELGISTASFFPRLFTEQAVEQIAVQGGKICEVFFASFCEYNRDFAAEVKRRADKGGVKIHSVHALTNQFEPELFSKGQRAYSDALKIFTSVCDAGKEMGAGYYTYHGATRLKPAVKYKFDYDHISSRVNTLCDIAAERGITLTYENVHWTYFSVPEYFTALKPLCPGLGATLDIKQAMQSHTDYNLFLDVMGDRLRTVHLCNYDENGRLTMPHDKNGVFDYRTLFMRLKDEGYEGPCLIEVYDSCYDDFSRIGESLDYLGDIADSIR